MAKEAFRSWTQNDPKYNRQEAWPGSLFPEAEWHYFKEAGCLVTSLAIMLRLFGLEQEQDPELFDPWILNEKMIKADIFMPNADLKIAQLNRLYPIEYLGSIPYSRDALIKNWETGEPFLITVPGVHGERHFVVPDGLTNDDMKIIDPAWRKQYLSDFDVVSELRLFRRQCV